MNDIVEHNQLDRHLVKSVLSGDNHAFTTIIKNTEGLVAQIVYKLIDNREDRRDLAQDIYLKVYSNLAGFKFNSKLSTWIAQIAYNTCLSHLQKRKFVLTDGLTGEGEDNAENTDLIYAAGTEHSIESKIFQRQRELILQVEIDRLPPFFKTLITLFHNEQLSYEEISVITALPAGTLKSYLFRARRQLKTNLLQRYKKDEI